ncbi:MAG TPA: hypothetical protein VKA25_03525 [Gemmatimonadales bacterium]|nr:hypothetical protein [Gemmatimonadales bacterium]
MTDNKTYTLHPDAPGLNSMIRQFGHILGDGVAPVWTQLPFPINETSPKPDGHLTYVSFQGDAYWVVDEQGNRYAAIPDVR